MSGPRGLSYILKLQTFHLTTNVSIGGIFYVAKMKEVET